MPSPSQPSPLPRDSRPAFSVSESGRRWIISRKLGSALLFGLPFMGVAAGAALVTYFDRSYIGNVEAIDKHLRETVAKGRDELAAAEKKAVDAKNQMAVFAATDLFESASVSCTQNGVTYTGIPSNLIAHKPYLLKINSTTSDVRDLVAGQYQVNLADPAVSKYMSDLITKAQYGDPNIKCGVTFTYAPNSVAPNPSRRLPPAPVPN